MEFSDKNSTKKHLLMLFDIIIIYIAIAIGFQFFCNLSEYKQYCIDDSVIFSVHKVDGSIENFPDKDFKNANEGDTIYLCI